MCRREVWLIFKSDILFLLMCLFDIITNVSLFPQWQNLHHFDTFIHIAFTDGNKMCDLGKCKCLLALITDSHTLKNMTCVY